VIAHSHLAHLGDQTQHDWRRQRGSEEAIMSDKASASAREIAQRFPVPPARVADRLLELLLPSEFDHRRDLVANSRGDVPGLADRQTAATPPETMAS
jgi:hypothetical protein